ncbi:serralysin [Bradyrhizobium sp. i1.4.4]|uniref:M10 family metallopeptidase C-terminal domain-containing protein n=1 Tax=Bradyrhizobium sp. RT10b TaxID=3156331 RepID=UPI003399C4ED
MANSVTVGATNNADIDGLLSGYKWTGTITYSFPDSPSDYSNPYYGGNSEPTSSGFAAAPSAMQAAINYAIGLILGYTNASIQYLGTNGANIMIAQSSKPPTSYAYYPGDYAAGGDVWFGTQYNYSLAKLGNYYFTTAMHELGHALGLKHSQETGGPANVAVPSAHDDSEYTIMSYRSYVGASTTAGYSNEAYGYPQTYMANDILALQTMYGANYATQGGNTVYSWNPTTGQEFINGVGQLAPGGGTGNSANRIYETIWDGGGIDTYDLSNYATNLSINLDPGATSLFSTVQQANLGDNQKLGYDHYASGNVYNAYLYNNDARSYIDNATGGSGNDSIIGNAIANVLNGGGSNDTITGGGGNDTIIGGGGTDTAVYSGSKANYGISYNSTTQVFTLVDQRSGTPDGTDTVSGAEYFQFADGTISSATMISQLLPPVVVEAIGATSLVQSGGNYLLNPTAGGSGPVLKYEGAAVTTGQFGDYTAIGVEAISNGYEVAWKNTATGLYSVWSTDASGNYTGNLYMPGTGNSAALQALETSFHQDLNGDGTIGIPQSAGVTIEAIGATALVVSGGNYLLNPVAGDTGPILKFDGLAVTVGQFGGFTPVGVEAVSNGYEVAWKSATTGQYSVWSTDTDGKYTGNFYMPGPGDSTAFQTLETSFHQDLNGDGTIGIAPSGVIEAIGATALTLSGSNYLLNPVAGGTGPTLKYEGAVVTVGQFAGYTPIGVEAIANGYEVAWQNTAAGMYSVWSTDASGNYTGNLYMPGPGNGAGLQTLETSFHQDLNGDGTIGTPPTVIEAIGTTALAISGSNYLLNPVAGGTGPTLKYESAVVTVGQFGGYTPIGVETVANGYEVAWKNAATGLYSVWSTDTTGNYTGNFYMPGPGNSTAFQTLENSFHQDLNGDGKVGVPAANTYAQATAAGDSFVFGSANSGQTSGTLTGESVGQQTLTLAAYLAMGGEDDVSLASSGGGLFTEGDSHQPTLLHDLQAGFIFLH